ARARAERRVLARRGSKRGGRVTVAKKPARDPLDGFACKLGDVIIRAGGDEAWLAGALVLAEDAPVAVLFVAPEAGSDRAVRARDVRGFNRIRERTPVMTPAMLAAIMRLTNGTRPIVPIPMSRSQPRNATSD